MASGRLHAKAPRHCLGQLNSVVVAHEQSPAGCSLEYSASVCHDRISRQRVFMQQPSSHSSRSTSHSECARLRTSYPSQHGLVLFSDPSMVTAAIPWCFPGTAGRGVIGYNVNIPIPRPGTLLLALSDIRPPTRFAAVSIDGTCWGDNTGKKNVRLGVWHAVVHTCVAWRLLHYPDHRREDR